MEKYLASLILGVCTLVGVAPVQTAGAVEDAVKRGAPRVGMDPIYMPFEMTNKRDQIIGLGVDLLKTMTEFMGVKLELVSTSYDSIIPALLTNKFGMVGSGMTLTQGHNLCLNSSGPFIVVDQALLVRKELENKIKSYKDLNDPQYSITPEISTAGEIIARKLVSKAKYHGFDNEPETVMDMVNGGADASIYDSPYNVVTVSKFGANKLVYLDQPFTYESLAFGLEKGSYDSISFINNFLYQVCEDGTCQRIRDRWFKNTEWLKEME